MLLDEGEGQVAQVRRGGAVGQGLGGRNPHDFTLAQRLLAIVAGFRLDAVDQAARAERERGQGRTRQQAAAAQADEQIVQLADFLEQLLGRGALPRDHVFMVVGRNQRGAGLGLDALGDLLAVFGVAVVRDDLAAIAFGGGALGRGCVQRHDDRGGHALQLGGQRDGLGVVARREGDDTPSALLRRQARDGVVAAAELEGAHALEILALEEDRCAADGVGRGRGQDGRAVCVAGQALAGAHDIIIGRQFGQHGNPVL
ncbi:hypothetical protein G6F31_015382 [Rhizopus arrhizus]|nr:hypothetical protein G6F31_015382 [Rhizopus arrhizus]